MQALLTKPYAEQVVICPHVYGPAVTHSPLGATGQGLFQRLSASFGYLTQQGVRGPNGNQVGLDWVVSACNVQPLSDALVVLLWLLCWHE